MMKNILLIVVSILFITAAGVQENRIKIACIGGSITYGYGLPDRATQSYPVWLQKMLGESYQVKNFGRSGATLLNKGHRPYMQQDEYRRAIDFGGDIVVIHLGINDTDPRDWSDYRDFFVKDYIELIGSFRAANSKVRIMITRFTPTADRHPRFLSGTRDWHGEIQLAIKNVARYIGAQLIDFHEPLYPYPFISTDAVYPDPEGTFIMVQTVYSTITGDYSELKMSLFYIDDIVLQRGVPLTVQGVANTGDRATVSIADWQMKTEAGLDGKWSITPPPLKVGGPYTLKISTDETGLQYQNVLAGEVWLCSGQLNMEFMLKQASAVRVDIPRAVDQQLHLYDVKARRRTNAVEWEANVLDSLNHLQYYKDTEWKNCTPATTSDFSAIAYYFGKMLRDSLNVPVGLTCNAVGGSPTEAWVDRASLEYQFPAILEGWAKNDLIQEWVRGRAALNIRKSANSQQRHPYKPYYLYESGIRSLEQYPIRGVIWYQEESNVHNWEAHEKLFRLLVNSWRKNWNDACLPFYYI